MKQEEIDDFRRFLAKAECPVGAGDPYPAGWHGASPQSSMEMRFINAMGRILEERENLLKFAKFIHETLDRSLYRRELAAAEAAIEYAEGGAERPRR